MERRPLRVLFLCTHNSCRSQMAEGWARHLKAGQIEASSAGTAPTRVHPLAVRVMAEAGVDISGQRAKSVTEFAGREFDVAVTLCDDARESCPFFPAKKLVHRAFEDPAAATGSEEEVLAVFRRVRDEIRAFVQGMPDNLLGNEN
ncbi:MAG: arsenate reductase ArsC [Desulfotomaculales bacterium]